MSNIPRQMSGMLTTAALAIAALAGSGAATEAFAQADSYPGRPVKLMVGFAAGGLTDVSARLYADEFQKRLGQPFVVENRPGASGLLAVQAVARSTPDGYTLVLASGAGVSPTFLKNGLDILKELDPVSNMQFGALAMFSNPNLPAKTFQELVAYAKSRPGVKLNLGASNNTLGLIMDVIGLRTGIAHVNIQYKGNAPVVQALASGEVDLAVDSIAAFKPLLDAGRIRALFVTKKTSLLPDVPTAAEVGLEGVDAGFNLGFWVPRDTPRPIIQKLYGAAAAMAASPDIKDKVRTMGSDSLGSTPEEFRRSIEAEARFWAEAARIGKYEPQ